MPSITEVLQALNIINLLNIVLPAGFGELVTLVTFNLFFLLIAVLTIVFALTKEQVLVNLNARISNGGVAIIIYPDGSSRERILKRNTASLEEPMDSGNLTWIVRNEGWQPRSNGVRYSFFHWDLPHNVSFNELQQFYKGYIQKVEVPNENGETTVVEVPYRPMILAARDVDAGIFQLAAAEVEMQVDPNKKLINAAIAISLVLAVAGALAIIFIMLPKQDTVTVTEVVKTAATTTTTLLNTGVAGVKGG